MKRYEEFINEKSTTRFINHLSKHDCVFITAFRYSENCGIGKIYSQKENLARNRKLYAQLMLKNYGVTKVNGVYIENFGSKTKEEIKSEEQSFLVVNLSDDIDFKDNVLNLGIEYEQDSILFIQKPKIERNLEIECQLISTNKCEDAFPGFGKIGVTKKFNKIKIGKFSDFMTTIGNKPFYITSNLDESEVTVFNKTYTSGIGLKYAVDNDWKNLIED